MPQEIQIDQLGYADRLQLAWAIVWPTLIIELLVWLPSEHLGLSGSKLEFINFVGGLLFTFLILPWVVRRTVRLSFPRFHLVVRRKSGEETRAMTYRESLSVAWLLNWRTGTILVIIFLLIYAAVWIVRGAPPESLNPFKHVAEPGLPGLVKLFVEHALVLVVLFFWTVKAAINKNYSDIWLRLEMA